MRVLIDNGSYHMDNMGDVAMLQVCVRRVLGRWPDAHVSVLVETPERLRAACPEVEPVKPSPWHVLPVVPRAGAWRGPKLQAVERQLPLYAPRLAYLGKRRYSRRQPERTASLDSFYRTVHAADLVMCSGGGFINDHHAEHAEKVLQTLALAQGLGKPTAMMGAGLGPLTSPDVLSLARGVFSRLDVLALREAEAGPRLVEELRAPPRRCLVTGDDAIELALEAQDTGSADMLGVNVRVAAHATASDEAVRSSGAAIASVADDLHASLMPLPVRNRWSPSNDLDGLESMFADASLDLSPGRQVTLPAHLLKLIARCRAVVTGAYHAAVFALSLGRPVVALAGSRYYELKFGGLAALFGAGIRIVRYDDPNLRDTLRHAVREAWEYEPRPAEQLRNAARRQRELSITAYDCVFRACESRRATSTAEVTP